MCGDKMDIMKDMIKLTEKFGFSKDIILKKTESSEEKTVEATLINPSYTQMIKLEYSPDHYFPIEFYEPIQLSVDDLKAMDKMYSKFHRDYYAEVYQKSMYFSDIKWQTPNPKITAEINPIITGELIDETVQKYPEIPSVASFVWTDKFDCKKANMLVIRGNRVYLAEVDMEKEEIISEEPTEWQTNEDHEENFAIGYMFLTGSKPFGKEEYKPSDECREINNFIRVFSMPEIVMRRSPEDGNPINTVMEIVGEKSYPAGEFGEKELHLTAKLLTAPRILKNLQL